MPPKTNAEIGELNEFKALRIINKMGWIRPQELGRLMWSEAPHGSKYGERIARTLQAKDLVIARKLPSHSGTALVLSTKGARFLNERVDVQAKSGKDFGETSGSMWQPPKVWKHDLLATSFIAHRLPEIMGFISEKQFKKAYPYVAKVPDALIVESNNEITWIEVEHARKSGLVGMQLMAKTIVSHLTNESHFFDRPCTKVGIAYPADSIDDRGYAINHRKRVTEAIKLQLNEGQSVEVSFYELQLRSGAVIGYEEKVARIEHDSLRGYKASLEVIETDEETGTMYLEIGLPWHTGCIEPQPDGFNWSVFLDRENPVPSHVDEKNGLGFTSTLSEAKREIASFVSQVQSCRGERKIK